MKWIQLFAVCLPLTCWSAVTISPVTEAGGTNELASLENENLRVVFLPATRAGLPSVRPQVSLRTGSSWAPAQLDPSAESYQVVSAPPHLKMQIPIRGFYPQWVDTLNTNRPAPKVIWKAGANYEAIVASVHQLDPQRLQLQFHPTPEGVLHAIWSLAPADKSIKVSLHFTPAHDGQFSLGYFLFNQKPLAQVDELLLPMLVQRKRFPATEYTLLQAQCPTPLSLMQVGQTCWALSGDPEATPFEFPVPASSRYGLHIRNPQGQVQPSIYGPLLGTPQAHAAKGQPVKFTFRLLVQPGDWYAGYRTVADEVFGWHDYRKNAAVSLTQAALNMIDLYLDDDHGGWWERAKAPYQVESKNGSTLSSPLTAVSLYYLTGDTNLYRRRTLPTLEFLLSRDGPHFSPIPEDTGGYAKGSMNGPVNIFGTTVYAGLWEMMNRRTPAFHDIAFPPAGVRLTTTQQNFETHNQPFDEWLGRYLFTGDKAALARAVQEADQYIARAIDSPPTRELGTNPFFLMACTPAWEGLLRLYEVTHEQRFLQAALKGAHLVMTGMWTQPTPASGDVTIHPGGFCHGDKLHLLLHKGAQEFRLGWPRQAGDTPEKRVPAWMVSNAGLGFEQPTTYTYRDNGGRMILQAPWASAFLRLAHYTGERQLETYARNATLGRWGNYPGYYYTTFTDLMQNPRYPYEGPDMSFVYYHHIPVHLSWTLDYLVSEALLRSQGQIQFPAVRQFGYAYFDNLVYGHAPGRVFQQEGAWLWLRKGLVALDNPQLNYLTAHTQDKFFLVLMNESSQQESGTVTFYPENITTGLRQFQTARVLSGPGGAVPLSQNAGKVLVPPRGLLVLQVDGLDIEVPAHRVQPPPPSRPLPGLIQVCADQVEARAAAIQFEPGPWEAYVWSTAGSGQLKELTLNWTYGEQSGTTIDRDYPYEFSIPVPTGHTNFTFVLSGIKADGTSFTLGKTNVAVRESPVVLPTRTHVPYGPDPKQFMNFYRAPSKEPAPAIIYIHGGAWLGGSADAIARSDVFGSANLRGEGIKRVLQQGISVISVEYRFLNQAHQAGVKPPVEWPLRDVARALQFVRSKAAEWNIDKRRIGLTGSSAGGCSSLWLAFHPDMADPSSPDPVARESTRVACAGVLNAQSSLDPLQLKDWFKEARYGGHAFGFFKQHPPYSSDMQACLAARPSILPSIREFSPIEWVSAEAPPVCLAYDKPPQPVGQPQLDSVHGAAHGMHLKEKLDAAGAECHLTYPGCPDALFRDHLDFLVRKLKW